MTGTARSGSAPAPAASTHSRTPVRPRRARFAVLLAPHPSPPARTHRQLFEETSVSLVEIPVEVWRTEAGHRRTRPTRGAEPAGRWHRRLRPAGGGERRGAAEHSKRLPWRRRSPPP